MPLLPKCCPRISRLRFMRRKQYLVTLVLAVIMILFYRSGSSLLNWLPFEVFSGDRVDVVIIEEHHEALPYWYEAAESDVIPKSGVTLLHIDGHADTALPEYVQDMPYFTWPENEDHLGLLLQSNDVFIEAAVMMGLIDRIIWIVPNWTVDDDNRNINKRVEIGKLDLTTRKTFNRLSHYTCQCEYDLDKKPSEGIECFYLNQTSSNDRDESLFDTKPNKCSVLRVYNFETVAEDKFLFKLRESGWLDDDVPLILDIDEDYFGCELAGGPLQSASLSWQMIEHLNNKLGELFCPIHIRHEQIADDMMKYVLNELVAKCGLSQGRKCINPFKDIQAHTENIVVDIFMKKPSLFCGENDAQIKTTWKDIAFMLYHFTYDQIAAILKVGFCFTMSPHTLGFYEGGGHIYICHGLNTPGNSAVKEHIPTPQETNQRMHTLDFILQRIPKPNLVTICRSVRDGYTPRGMAMDIENRLLDILKSSQKTNTFRVKYDIDLFKGETGWPTG